MKKFLAFLLIASLLLSVSLPAFAVSADACAVIGADLSEEQIAEVYALFNAERGNVPELRVTNKEERSYLEGLVDEAVIGTRSISCVFVQLTEKGSGIHVKTDNITWCTPEMYENALTTAGITDAEIIVAAPFEVSGTAALTGVYKAYESMTGEDLDDAAKEVGTRELTVTGELADELGSEDTFSIIGELKTALSDLSDMSDEELRRSIEAIAAQYNVTLSDKQLRQLIDLCRSFSKLDPDALIERVDDVKETIKKVSGAKDKFIGFLGRVKNAYDRAAGFFEKVKSFLGF